MARFGVFEFNFRTGELRRRGYRIKLHGQPLQLLAMLLERPGETVTREEMRKRLWPEGTFVDFEHSLNTAVKKLRQTLRDSAAKPHFIETVSRQGYRFIGSVQVVDEFAAPKDDARPVTRRVEPEDAVHDTSSTPQAAPRVTTEEPAPRLSRRQFAVFIGLITSLLIAVIALANLVLRSHRTRQWQSRLTLLVSGEALPSEPAIAPDGKMLAYVAEHAGTKRIFVRRVAGGEVMRLAQENMDEAEPAFSPDGERIAFTRFLPPSGRPQICVMPVLGGEIAPVVENAHYPAWSGDGTRLAFILEPPGKPPALATSAIDGSGLRILLLGDSTYFFLRSPAWSPDSRLIAVERSMGGVSGEIWLVPSQGGTPLPLEAARPGVYSHRPVFTPDGKNIVYSSNRAGALNLWSRSLEDGETVQLTEGAGADKWPSVGPEGVAFSNSHRKDELFVYNLQTGRRVCLLEHTPFLWAPAFSPDGQEIAFSQAEHSGQWHIWRVPVTEGKPRQLTSGQEPQIYPRYSPDGKWVTYFTWSAGGSRIWKLPRSGGAPQPVTPSDEDAAYGDVSPDGRLLVFARIESQASHIYIVPVSGGPERRLTSASSTVPRWSPDGQWIAFSPDHGYGSGVFIIRPDGSGMRRVTETGGWPVWFPNTKRIAFRTLRPDGTQQVEIVELESGKVGPVSRLDFSGNNYPFEFSRDGKFTTYTNGTTLSSEIWLLSPRY